jgi:hypothetical protein
MELECSGMFFAHYALDMWKKLWLVFMNSLVTSFHCIESLELLVRSYARYVH